MTDTLSPKISPPDGFSTKTHPPGAIDANHAPAPAKSGKPRRSSVMGSAARMRRLRERRVSGSICLTIEIMPDEVEAMRRAKYLKRTDAGHDAIARAVFDIFDDALGLPRDASLTKENQAN